MNSDKNKIKKCYGIDLGTTLSVCGVWDNNTKSVKIIEDENGQKLIPSIVSFTEDNERLVGESARKYGLKNLNKCIQESKRLMGKKINEINREDFNYKLSGDQYDKVQIIIENKSETSEELIINKLYPEQIAAAILQKIKLIIENKMNDEVNDVVITVPAYFNDSQRTATKNAAKIAGLNCINIINEPTAACLCYGLHKLDQSNGSKLILVYDLGGGTLDVSLVELCDGIFQVKAICGDTELGGKDFDKIISEYLIKIYREKTNKDILETDFNKLKELAEKTKKELSSRLSSMVEIDFNGITCSVRFTRVEFEKLSKDLFERCMEPVKTVLKDAYKNVDDIDEIVLVGGSSRIPKVQHQLSELFNNKKLNNSVNPDEAVAYGAAIQGAILSESDNTGTTNNLVLIDVIPLSLGLKLYNGLMDVIIPKNTSIPTTMKKIYTTTSANQKSVKIDLYEGERLFVKDNHKLGEFELTNLPSMRKGQLKIEVDFYINTDGILTVSACTEDDAIKSSIIINTVDQLTSDDIETMIHSAETYRLRDQISLERLKLTQDLENYIENQQYLINSPDANLPEDIISDSNQLMLQTIEWLNEPDVLTDELPNPEAIRQCKDALKFRLDQIPWSKAFSRINDKDLIENDIDNSQLSTDDLNNLLANLNIKK